MDIETTIKYPIDADKNLISENLQNIALNAGVTLAGAGNISVNGEQVTDIIFGGDIDVQVTSDTAVVTYIEPNLENFVQNVSMQGGTAQIVDGLLNISVTAVDLDGYVNSVSVTGGTGGITNNTLNLNIPTARQVINNSTVSGANFLGNGIKSITYSEGVANVSIETAEAGEVTVNGYSAPKLNFSGGGAVISYDSVNDQINIAIETNKANPMLSVASTYLLPNTTKVIEVESLSDGIITTIPNDVITARQVSSNQFEISATQVGNVQLGFTQQATEAYYGSSKNALISVVNQLPDVLQLDFNNLQDLYENSGTAGIYVLTPEMDSDTAVTLTSLTLGDYRAVTGTPSGKSLLGNLSIGGSPFTVEFRGMFQAPWGSYYGYSTTWYGIYAGDTLICNCNAARGTGNTTFTVAGTGTPVLLLDNYHFALSYDGDSTLRMFYNGTLQATVNVAVARGQFKFVFGENGGWYPVIAQFNVIDGVCKYQSNFTPLF